MTFERNPVAPAEPGLASARAEIGSVTPSTGPTPVQIRLQILSTEHWSLLASRSLAWNESFSRAGMFLSTLSGAMVALGLIGGVDGFGDAFFAFAFVLLPVELFIGIGTLARMTASNYHDAMTVFGMNRIRGAYLEIAPDLAPYFVMGVHDDPAGIGVTMAVPPRTPTLVHLLASTPFLIHVLNGVLAGAIAALIAVRSIQQPSLAAPVLVGVAVAVVTIVVQLVIGARAIRSGQGLVRPMFPTPGADAAPGSTPPRSTSPGA